MGGGSCLNLMTRRFAMLFLVLVAALAGAAETRPNIVLVIGEDMGPDTGAYGCKDAITPNMDRLAREGAQTAQWVKARVKSAPSRASRSMLGVIASLQP